ncbi:MAG TPA: prephenate dehydrogenase/arogenate dehydrogenase family protein [Gaiellaceae bacterium]|nr:prephenate dehydrogenase/arogenate dehydrogenase family protein [Gaiellaceae bacterium]
MSGNLGDLRGEISTLDRRLLELLNRRLELVAQVRSRKEEAGERWIDAEREAELLRELTAANRGPLSERGVAALFSAILDVLKQEVAAERPGRREGAFPAAPDPGIARLAVVGTGLVGTSVALAARRAGVACSGFDRDEATLAEAAGIGRLRRAASLAEAVGDAELVVVAVPAGAAAEAVREALAAAGPDATVTDVASTKRALAGVDDPRFVPGHPVAGGASGGPRNAAADLFDGATWFLTPGPGADGERVARVERFVRALGAQPVRTDAAAHDRLLALTSHLPHALANLLMLRVAAAAESDDAPLAHAGASLREMTRVAGANAGIWADIFLENADEIGAALAGFREALDGLERELRAGDRAAVEASIASAAEARARMLGYAYRTEAAQLHRIRVRVPDRPGVLARITQILGAARLNIEDFELRHVSPEYGGVLVILVAGADSAEKARELLRREGYPAV